MCRDKDNRHHIYVAEKIDVKPSGNEDADILEITDKCTKVIESFIREHPDEWVWFHKKMENTETGR